MQISQLILFQIAIAIPLDLLQKAAIKPVVNVFVSQELRDLHVIDVLKDINNLDLLKHHVFVSFFSSAFSKLKLMCQGCGTKICA